MANLIPKKIHYCWFGDGDKPESVIFCINTWKRFCPDYEIIEWNEKNYDIKKCDYIREAYQQKKWAFVSDFARLDIIYEYGGIYLDTDVELIKSLDPLLENSAYIGMEDVDAINTGQGFGAIKGAHIIKELRELYFNRHFIVNGRPDLTTCVAIATQYFVEKGFVYKNQMQEINDMVIYPTDFFCPIKPGHNKVAITDNTYSIHHYMASWYDGNKQYNRMQYRLIPLKKKLKIFVNRFFGERIWEKLKYTYHSIKK